MLRKQKGKDYKIGMITVMMVNNIITVILIGYSKLFPQTPLSTNTIFEYRDLEND